MREQDMWRDLRLQSKLLVSFLSLGLLAVLMTGWQSYRSAKTVLEEASLNALAASCDTDKRSIQDDFARTMTGNRSTPVLSAYAPLNSIDAQPAMLAKSHATETFDPVSRLRQKILGLAGIMGLIVAALAIGLARAIALPLQRLTADTGMLGRDDLSYRIPVSSADDVGQLATAFNHITETLQQTTVSKDYADNILASMNEALLVASPAVDAAAPDEAVIVKANPAACALLGYTESDLLGLPFRHVFADTEAPAYRFEDVLQQGHMGSRETICRMQDGRQVPVLFSGAVMRGAGQDSEELVCVAQALTELNALKARHQVVRKALGLYITDDVMPRVLDTPELLQIGGESHLVTVLRSALRGVTSLSEQLSPAQVVAVLNRYMEAMMDVITHYQGTIDETMGDGMIVVFGAPLARDDDAQRAMACAVAMQLAMAEVNTHNRGEGLPEIEMGIGIHTGEVVAGNIGSQKQAKYSVMGRVMRIAGHIETYAAGGQILISEATHPRVAAWVRIDHQMTVAPQDAQAPMQLYFIGGMGSPYDLFLPEPPAHALAPPASDTPSQPVAETVSPFLRFAPVGHFYSPLPNLEEVIAKREILFDRELTTCPGINLHEYAQLALLDELAAYYDEVPFPEMRSSSTRYYYQNDFFGHGDAIILYAMLRRQHPRRVIEIGSGFSSSVMLDVNDLFLDNSVQFTFIEPYPERLFEQFRDDDQQRHTVIEKPLQDVPLSLFRELSAGDILFIDSSHVVKIGSDVAYILFHILPELQPGVFIHFHDILWPFEYPEDWIFEGRAWNEAYVLRSFLQFNHTFDILYYNSYVWQHHADRLQQKMPLCNKNPGGSIWIKKTAALH